MDLEVQGNNKKLLAIKETCDYLGIGQTKCRELLRGHNGFGVENKGNFFDELRGKNIFAPSGTINGVTVRNVIKDYVLIRDEIEERPPYYSYSSRKSDRNYYD